MHKIHHINTSSPGVGTVSWWSGVGTGACTWNCNISVRGSSKMESLFQQCHFARMDLSRERKNTWTTHSEASSSGTPEPRWTTLSVTADRVTVQLERGASTTGVASYYIDTTEYTGDLLLAIIINVCVSSSATGEGGKGISTHSIFAKFLFACLPFPFLADPVVL